MRAARSLAIVSVALLMAPACVLPQDALPRAVMAFLDYDAFHDALIERCTSQFGESAVSLRAAIGRRPPMRHSRSLRSGDWAVGSVVSSEIAGAGPERPRS